MIRIWLFLHLLGFTMWLGGGLASMVAGIAAKRESRAALGALTRAQAALQRTLVAPGALFTVVSGLILTFRVSAMAVGATNVWLLVMQGAGIVAALLSLFIALPTATKLAQLDPEGPHAAHFDELRQRYRIVSSISGTLGLTALLAGAMMRFGG